MTQTLSATNLLDGHYRSACGFVLSGTVEVAFFDKVTAADGSLTILFVPSCHGGCECPESKPGRAIL